MADRIDRILEWLVIEGNMLWQFIWGSVVLMMPQTLLCVRLIGDSRFGSSTNIIFVTVLGLSIGTLWGVICWALMRVHFSYASSRFINFTRMMFPIAFSLAFYLVYALPYVMRPDPPGYISNREVFFTLGLVLFPLLPLFSRAAIIQTTQKYLDLLDIV
jgi:hypothetical protein